MLSNLFPIILFDKVGVEQNNLETLHMMDNEQLIFSHLPPRMICADPRWSIGTVRLPSPNHCPGVNDYVYPLFR